MTNIKCKCGAVEIALKPNTKGTRAKCYCESCRGFVQFCGASDRYLNSFGGVEIFATIPSQISIIKGQAMICATQINIKGSMRWHCEACMTPLVNSINKSSIPFMALVLPLDQHFPAAPELGVVKAAYMTKNKINAGAPDKDFGFPAIIWGFVSRMIKAKLSGKSKETDWHDNEGNWIKSPIIFTAEQRDALYKRAKSL